MNETGAVSVPALMVEPGVVEVEQHQLPGAMIALLSDAAA